MAGKREQGTFKEPKERPGSYSKGPGGAEDGEDQPSKAQSATVRNQVFSTRARKTHGAGWW